MHRIGEKYSFLLQYLYLRLKIILHRPRFFVIGQFTYLKWIEGRFVPVQYLFIKISYLSRFLGAQTWDLNYQCLVFYAFYSSACAYPIYLCFGSTPILMLGTVTFNAKNITALRRIWVLLFWQTKGPVSQDEMELKVFLKITERKLSIFIIRGWCSENLQQQN